MDKSPSAKEKLEMLFIIIQRMPDLWYNIISILFGLGGRNDGISFIHGFSDAPKYFHLYL